MGDPVAKSRKRGRIKTQLDPTNLSSNSTSSPNYLIVRRIDGDDFKKVSPFFIDKCITNSVGNVKNIKKLRDGTLLIETTTNRQTDKLLNYKDFGEQFKVEVSPHKYLNYSKGVIRCYDLQFAEPEEIKNELKNTIVDITRIKIKINGVEKYTHSYIVTFPLSRLPEMTQIGYHLLRVQLYTPNPMRCFNCFGFSHPTSKCKKNAMCANCGEKKHDENNQCNKPQIGRAHV